MVLHGTSVAFFSTFDATDIDILVIISGRKPQTAIFFLIKK